VLKQCIGIATYPLNGRDAESLLKHADTAMYQAKSRGRNSYEFYSSDMSARATVKLSLESSLHSALERGQLTLHFQPQVSMVNGALVGFEALARWRHPRLGYISPYAFIPLAEESGLIAPLGEWALESVCRQLVQWRAAGLPVVPVAVNVSAQQLVNSSVGDLIERVLTESGLPGSLLEVELTETVLVDDVRRVSNFLERLQALGVRTSIDDFGTGYSGLSYLAQMPINSLKIDRSFVQQIGSPSGDHGIVGAIIALAGNLGLEVVAEGVETVPQARSLLEHGCGRMQGYLVSPPVPADRVPALLERQTLFVWPEGDQVVTMTRPHQVDRTLAPLLTDPRVAALLQAVCSADASAVFDADVLAAVLSALQPAARPATLARPLSARVATGTFAGLVPLSGGLAAAGALPAPIQQVYSQFLSGFGIPVPAAPGTGAEMVAAGPAKVTNRHVLDGSAGREPLVTAIPGTSGPHDPAAAAGTFVVVHGGAAGAASPGAAPTSSVADTQNVSSVTSAPSSGGPFNADVGSSGATPAQSGSAPGNSGSAPGNSGSTPAQSGSAPGNSGSAPGGGALERLRQGGHTSTAP